MPSPFYNNNYNNNNNNNNTYSNHNNNRNSQPMTTIIPTVTTTSPATTTKLSARKQKITKSSSLDHEIFLQHHSQQKPESQQQQYSSTQQQQQQQPHSRRIPAAEWKRYSTQPAGGGSMKHAGSTSSLASVATTTTNGATLGGNYQELKMEIINQGKCLCGQYIRSRLRRAGVLNRKATQRLRSLLDTTATLATQTDVVEVFPALNSMGEELERLHPRVYTNVARQLSHAPFGDLPDGETAPMLLNLVAKDLFRSSITWGKIISIFAVCGGFAIDCVRQGHYDYLQFLIDGLAEIIEDDLVYWLLEHGGWLGLKQHIRRPREGNVTFLGMLAMFVAVSSSVYVISNFVKHLGCHLYSLLF